VILRSHRKAENPDRIASLETEKLRTRDATSSRGLCLRVEKNETSFHTYVR
jgi:hypothetical protein